MTIHEGLNVVTLIMCVVTLTMASLALLPHIRQGLTILRDSVLWAVVLAIVIAVGVIGWHRLVAPRQSHTRESTAEEASGDYPSQEHHSAVIADRYPTSRRPWGLDSGF